MIQIDGQDKSQTSQFQYLGLIIHEDGEIEKHMILRIKRDGFSEFYEIIEYH